MKFHENQKCSFDTIKLQNCLLRPGEYIVIFWGSPVELYPARKSIIKNRLAGNRLKPCTIKPAPISMKPSSWEVRVVTWTKSDRCTWKLKNVVWLASTWSERGRLHSYCGITLRSPIEAPLITREVLPETYFLLVIMAADAQVRPYLHLQASCWCGTL